MTAQHVRCNVRLPWQYPLFGLWRRLLWQYPFQRISPSISSLGGTLLLIGPVSYFLRRCWCWHWSRCAECSTCCSSVIQNTIPGTGGDVLAKAIMLGISTSNLQITTGHMDRGIRWANWISIEVGGCRKSDVESLDNASLAWQRLERKNPQAR